VTVDTKAMSKDLLRSVSRSFYLSMKVLPLKMRDLISLAYLLARASDTIADTASAPPDLRLELLKIIRNRIVDKGEASDELFNRVKKDFIPHQDHDGEKQLLIQLHSCFEWLSQMDHASQLMVTMVLGNITKGQIWDVERFAAGDQNRPGFVDTTEELEQYTYWVAGSVGEFWTEVGFSHGGSHFSNEGIKEMKELGRKYGQGLQLVNVLRDLGEDLHNGRCYLPKNEFSQQGWNGEGGWPPNEMIIKVSEKWREQCREWIHAGQQYAKRVKPRRVRFATVLPMLIAEKTVELLDEAGPEILQQKVKISRGEIRKLMARAIFF